MKKLFKFNYLFLVFALLFFSGCKSPEFSISLYLEEDVLWDDITVSNEEIELPIPEKDGYHFNGWYDSDGREYPKKNVFNKSVNLYAQWRIKVFNVTFLDYEKNVLQRFEINYGENVETIIAPKLEGYEFIGWDSSLKNIKENVTVRPLYRPLKYTITFLDWDDKIILEGEAFHGGSIISPELPYRAGYEFINWDQDLTNIKGDMVIRPIYEKRDFEFIMNDDNYCLIKYFGSDADVIIPDVYQGLNVTKIASGAFANNKNIVSVTFPESLIEIEDHAFFNCQRLERAPFPAGILIIGEEAFADCWSLEEVIFPEGIVKIGNGAFRGCDLLEEIVLPNSIEEMGFGIFENCFRIKKVTIYAQVIGEGAFMSCSMLSDITIAESVKAISAHAFYACTKLINVYIPPTIAYIGDNAFSWCRDLKYLYTDADNVENLIAIVEAITHIYTKFEVAALK